MKKNVLFFAAFAATCLVVSCNKVNETVEQVPGMKTLSLTAVINEADTKTSYAGGTTFSWTAGDKISVLCSDDNLYEFTASSTAASTTFTGTVPDGVSLGDKAYFPADLGNTATKINIPKTKDLTGHPSAEIPMVGDKGVGNVFTFSHCAGAALLTIDNIPSGIVSVKIQVVNASLKLSGAFTINGSAGDYYWDPDGKDGDNDTFIRTVSVVDHAAEVYIPYSCNPSYGNMWAANTLNVIGYDSYDNPTALVTDKAMKAIGTFTRAHVIPLTPLVLTLPNYSDPSAVTTTCGATHTEIEEMTAVADAKFLYMRFHGTTASWTGGEFHLYMGDGNPSGASIHWGWTTKGTSETNISASKSISTSSFSGLTVAGTSCQTKCETVGDQTYWEIAIPRSATPLLSSAGTVYVGIFVLETSTWGFTAAIPEVSVSSPMIAVTLP